MDLQSIPLPSGPPTKSIYNCTLTGIEPANSAIGIAVIHYISVYCAFVCM
jgi:hypothetical protein